MVAGAVALRVQVPAARKDTVAPGSTLQMEGVVEVSVGVTPAEEAVSTGL